MIFKWRCNEIIWRRCRTSRRLPHESNHSGRGAGANVLQARCLPNDERILVGTLVRCWQKNKVKKLMSTIVNWFESEKLSTKPVDSLLSNDDCIPCQIWRNYFRLSHLDMNREYGLVDLVRCGTVCFIAGFFTACLVLLETPRLVENVLEHSLY